MAASVDDTVARRRKCYVMTGIEPGVCTAGGDDGATTLTTPRHRRDGGNTAGRRVKLVAGALTVATVSAGIGGAAAIAAQPLADTDSIRSSAPVHPAGNGDPLSTEEVAAKALPSVVELQSGQLGDIRQGSGIILSSDGLILTNDHVVATPDNSSGHTSPQTRVTLNDGRSAPFTVVGADPPDDIAVVRAQGFSALTPITLGSTTALRVGQQVVALGSPLGLTGTVTSGIISALNRRVAPTGGQYAALLDAIQTDAPLNPGSSGGALVDMTGRLIGLNSAYASPGDAGAGQTGSSGLGFAIPVDQAKRIADELIAMGTPSQAPVAAEVTSPAWGGPH
jgi:putative serine protease PepD